MTYDYEDFTESERALVDHLLKAMSEMGMIEPVIEVGGECRWQLCTLDRKWMDDLIGKPLSFDPEPEGE